MTSPRKSRRQRLDVTPKTYYKSGNEDENYYSIIGSDAITASKIFTSLDAQASPDKTKFRVQETFDYNNYDFKSSQEINGEYETSFIDETGYQKNAKKLIKTTIFNLIDSWNEEEISNTLKGLSESEVQILEACWKGQMDMVHDAFMKHKNISQTKLVNCTDWFGRTPLHLASAFGHSQIVQFLLQNGAIVDTWDNANQVTPLGCACASGSLQVVEILIAHGANVDAGLGRTLTPLHWGLHSANSFECVRKLLTSKCSQNSYNIEVGTPLHLAASLGNYSCLKLLLENEANVTLCKGQNLWTTLHIAANDGYAQCVELLISNGAKVDARDTKSVTPLHLSAAKCDGQVTAVLLSHKANANARDCDGRTPLHKTIPSKGLELESAECILLLLEHCAKIDAQDNFGHSPLHVAALSESPYTASFLLQHGADVTCRTKSGQSALSLLVKKMPHVLRHVKEALDNAVSINTIDPNDSECLLKLDFRTIAPSSHTPRFCENSIDAQSTNEDLQKETEFLECLIKTGYKAYLSHPLIEAFIILKWKRVRVFFWISTLFCAITVILYSAYVYEMFVNICPLSDLNLSYTSKKNEYEAVNNFSSYSDTSANKIPEIRNGQDPVFSCKITSNPFLQLKWLALCIFAVIITVKEIFHMMQGIRIYFSVLEHYLQWVVLLSVALVAWPFPMNGVCLEAWHHPSAAVGSLFAWSLLLVRIGRFPALGIYVQMLVNVIKNFALFASAYLCLIIGFTFSFIIMFPEEPAFNNIQKAMLKLLTMMVGDLTYDELLYQRIHVEGSEIEVVRKLMFPWISHLLFAAFVLFVGIIMMNLLVGLAVHDIQKLEKDAKLEGLLRQSASIAGLESFLFSKGVSKCLPVSLSRCLRRRALLVPSSYQWTFYFRPNDPRDSRLPKTLLRDALCLATSKKTYANLKGTKNAIRNSQRSAIVDDANKFLT